MRVPEVLLNGNHADIRAWRRKESLIATARFRPDLLAGAELTPEEKAMLKEMDLPCS